MDFFVRTRITFTAELSVLDLFLKTVHGGHASERVRDATNYFLLPISQLRGNESFSRKAVLPRHAAST